MLAVVVAVALFAVDARVTHAAAATARTEPGPVRDGYVGTAYVVPTRPTASDPNMVRVELRDADGEVVGADAVRSGRAWRVEALDGDDAGSVAIAWDGGLTAVADRRDFWVMPEFVALRDARVVVDGEERPLGSSGVVYHRGSSGLFDSPFTVEYDGIALLARRAVGCHRDTWSIGQQTFTVDLIEAGLHRDDRSLVDKGVVGLQWGMSLAFDEHATHQLPRDCNGDETVPDFGKTHHTTQWLESMGRATYLLAASEWAGEYRDVIDATVERIELVATGLTEQRNWEAWLDALENSDGHIWTHRTYMMAAALGLASTLTDDADDADRWAEMAEWIARRGIENQWDAGEVGVNPERGGFDLQYQMYGVWLAQIYRSTLGEQSAISEELDRAIDRAIEWERGRIDPVTGEIDIRGSTRVCAETLWWSGTASERLDPAETIRALLLWGHTTGRRDLVELAVHISDTEKRQGHPCPEGERPRSTTTVATGRTGVAAGGSGRGFDTPIGTLSMRRVLAAAGVGGVVALGLLRVRVARWSRRVNGAARLGVGFVVFGIGLLLLAA